MSHSPGFRVFQYSPLDLSQVGGVEHHIRRLSDELRLLGCVVDCGAEDEAAGKPGTPPTIIHSHGDRLPPARLVSGEGALWVHTLHGTSIGRALACREYLGLRAYLAAMKEGLASHWADGLIFVSEGVGAQARRYFRVPRRLPSTVIPNGADAPAAGAPRDFDAYKPFLLFLGRGDDRVKNTSRLVEAYLMARARRPDLRLLTAPGRGFPEGLPGLERLDSVTMLQKSALYSGACALALPSLYEADSLVIWEALAHGTPVIVSDGVGRSQALGGYDAVRVVAARDVPALAEAFIQAASSPRRGTPVLRPWSQVAAETLAFYQSLRNAIKPETLEAH